MIFRLARSALASFAIAAQPAFADVTAPEVWDTLQDYAASAGIDLIAGQRAYQAGVLSIRDLVYTVDQPQGELTVRIPAFSLRESGGDVELIWQDGVVEVEYAPAGAEIVSARFMTSSDGLSVLFAGSPDKLLLATTAQETGLALQYLTVGDDEVDLDASIRLRDITQNGEFTTDANGQAYTEGAGRIGKISFDFEHRDPEEKTRQFAKGSIEDYVFQSRGQVANLAATTPFPQGDLDSTATFGAVRAQLDAEIDGKFALVDLAGTSGFSQANVDRSTMSYSGGLTGSAVRISGDALPVGAIEFGIDASVFSLTLPTQPDPEPQPFSLSFSHENITLSQAVWDQFDPDGVLVQDPANLRFSISGTAIVKEQLADPEFDPLTVTSPPMAVESLVIDEIRLSALGAEFLAGGELGFDAEEFDGFDRLPETRGFVDLKILGLGAAMDGLTRAGILPPGHSGMVQMMLGLFAQQGPEPGSFESRIEIGPGGEVSANGQRLR